MRATRSAAGAVLAAVLAATALAGCGRASNSGVAARVGDVVIHASRLAAMVDRSFANAQFATTVGDDRDDYVRGRLGALIEGELLREAARRLGIVVTEAQVDARIARFVTDLGSRERLEEQAASQGVAPADLHDAVGQILLSELVGAKLVENEPVPEAELRRAYRDNLATYDRAHVAHILVASKATADQVARRARAGEDFGALARRFSTDAQTKDRGGDLGVQGRGALDPAFERVMFATAQGRVGGPVRTRFGWHVVKVVERQLTTYAQARPALRERIVAPKAERARAELLTDIARTTRIRVNPRFGRWDAASVSVAPPADDLSSPVPVPGSAAPDLGGAPGAPGTGPGTGPGAGPTSAPSP